MALIDALIAPGAAIGCVIGIGLSAGLQWLFPAQDLLPAQALLVVVCSVAGLVIEHHFSDKPPR
jgi:hypothetical protein